MRPRRRPRAPPSPPPPPRRRRARAAARPGPGPEPRGRRPPRPPPTPPRPPAPLARRRPGALAFDGAYMQVPGAGGSAGFNSRFVQPTRHPSMLEEHDYPADAFPFTGAPSRDPVTGGAGSTLANARDVHGRAPLLIIANT